MKIIRTKIVRSRETREWIVRAYTERGWYPAADYYTDDKKDAEDTARHMVSNATGKGRYPKA